MCGAKRPLVDMGLPEGKLVWRQGDGGRTDAPNMEYFLAWADPFFGRPSVFAVLVHGVSLAARFV